MKRKDKLDRLERERFGKNMAQMAGSQLPPAAAAAASATSAGSAGAGAGASGTPASSGRWEALRSFISQTMDHNPEFKAEK